MKLKQVNTLFKWRDELLFDKLNNSGIIKIKEVKATNV